MRTPQEGQKVSVSSAVLPQTGQVRRWAGLAPLADPQLGQTVRARGTSAPQILQVQVGSGRGRPQIRQTWSLPEFSVSHQEQVQSCACPAGGRPQTEQTLLRPWFSVPHQAQVQVWEITDLGRSQPAQMALPPSFSVPHHSQVQGGMVRGLALPHTVQV